MIFHNFFLHLTKNCDMIQLKDVVNVPIGKRLNDLISSRNENVNSVANQIGVSPQTIYSIIKRDNMKVDFDILMKLAKCLEVSVEYFYEPTIGHKQNNIDSRYLEESEFKIIKKYRSLSFGGKKAVDNMIDFIFNLEQEQKRQDNIHDINIRRLPLYAVPASAGTGNFLDDSPYEIIEVGADAPMQTSYLLRASGDSMEPKIQDGDTLYIKQQNFVEDGEIGIFWYDGQVYVKKFERHGNASYLVSLNPKYAPIKVNGDPIRCYGKVLNK